MTEFILQLTHKQQKWKSSKRQQNPNSKNRDIRAMLDKIENRNHKAAMERTQEGDIAMGYQHHISLTCLIFISILHFAYPLNEGRTLLRDTDLNDLPGNRPEDWVNAHNKVRKAVGVGPVRWNATVFEYAKAYGNVRRKDCALKHSETMGKFGENIATGTGKEFKGTDAVNMWASEKEFWDPKTMTCQPNKVCGHYTQMIWKKAINLGCIRVSCPAGDKVFFSCNYGDVGEDFGKPGNP